MTSVETSHVLTLYHLHFFKVKTEYCGFYRWEGNEGKEGLFYLKINMPWTSVIPTTLPLGLKQFYYKQTLSLHSVICLQKLVIRWTVFICNSHAFHPTLYSGTSARKKKKIITANSFNSRGIIKGSVGEWKEDDAIF